MDQNKAQIEERIRNIRVRFVAAIPQFIIDSGERWKRLRHTAWDARLAADLQNFVHKLAGSGATFGFPDVSRAARTLDVALGAALEAGGNPAAETMLTLERQVNDLLSVLRAAQADMPGAEPAVAAAPASRQAPLVVIIDDDDMLKARLAAVLERAGYRVAAFDDPAAATRQLRQEAPALVLLDIMFPGRARPAFEVIAEIRAETGERTPVAVISGRADFASRLDASRAGADGYLVKPLDENHLLETTSQLTNRQRTDNWRCLVVDDDALLAEQLVAWLEQAGLTADCVTAPRDSWLKITEFEPDVIVMDVNMPECNGIELATMLRQDARTALLPIVFLTSDSAEGTRRDAMAAGADDYLLKPVDHMALIRSIVTRARLGKRLQEQVSRVTQEAPQSAGLSRHFFFTELERALDDADDGPVQSALVLLGLVEAAGILQSHGTPGLAAVQEQWLTRLAAAGVSRWAVLGENIVGILLPRDGASRHPARVREIMAALAAKPYTVKGASIAAGLGAAVLHLRRSQSSVPAILSQAEQLLGLAVTAGAGSLQEGFLGTAGPDTTESTGQLPMDQLRAVYQPIVTIDGVGSPVNSVLARITDKDGNLMPPGRFLAVLEKRGWLPDLDGWIFRNAHKVLTSQIPAEAPMFLVVHASPQSLTSAVYVETVLTVLGSQPMRQPDQCIVLAVPETAWVTHRSTVEQLSQALMEAGGGLMLMGYGASATSVAALEALQPLFVRLDDALARRLEQADYAPADRALMNAALAANVSVVASGIENARSLSALWSKGVRRFQGYFIQEPSAVLDTGHGA
jgi:DNA-binding response OmpR family regulator/EAL domain-containing protein (putative c-di-GMP-specific phosphodiesterase class I)